MQSQTQPPPVCNSPQMPSQPPAIAVEAIFTQLCAEFEEARKYSIRVALNNEVMSRGSTPEIFASAEKTRTPTWNASGRKIILPAKTYLLKLHVSAQSAWTVLRSEASDAVGEGCVFLYQLSPVRPSKIAIVSPDGRTNVGWVYLQIQLRPPQETRSVGAYNTIRSKSGFAASMMSVYVSLQSLDPHLAKKFKLAVEMGCTYSRASLEYLTHISASNADFTRVPIDNAVWDLARQVDLQLQHLVTVYWPTVRTPNSVVGELLHRAAQALALIFGFINCHTVSQYHFIDLISATCGQGFRGLLHQLLILGAYMRRILHEDLVRVLAISPAEVLRSLARKYAREFNGVNDPSGPWIDFMDCMYGTLAEQMLDAFKTAIDSTAHRPEEAGFRSAARRLMTMLARNSERLPPSLIIDPSTVTIADSSSRQLTHTKHAMRGGIEGDFGSSGIVTFGVMRVTSGHRKSSTVDVAIKGIVKTANSGPIKHTYLEILAGWTLSHERLLPTLGVMHRDGEMLSIVTEHMKGGNIQDWMQTSVDFARLRPDQVKTKLNNWLAQIAEGLKYMHAEGVVHGDLRGKNIFIDSKNDPTCDTVVIADFGLSIYVESISKAFESTRAGNVRYCAPELQLRCKQDAALLVEEGPQFRVSPSARPTKAADLFSFSMLCIELYTRKEPFVMSHPEATNGEVQVMILAGTRPTPLPSEILSQPVLASAIQRCWQQNPAMRGDAAALLTDISSLV